jgi:predicted dehydrogenase
MTDKLKVALIGCGRMGYSWDKGIVGKDSRSHFSAIMKSQDFELVCIAEKNLQTREEITSNHGIPSFSDYRKMLFSMKKLDLVVVATPDETHSEILMNLVSFKPKCVFAEKPLAIGSKKSTMIARAYISSGIDLIINFSRRFLPKFETLRENILSQYFGEPLSMTIHFSGSVQHNGIHFLDLANWFFGKPIESSITASNFHLNSEKHQNDSFSMHLSYETGMSLNLIGVGINAPSLHEIDFIGTKGRFRVTTNGILIEYGLKEFQEFPDFHFYEEIERSNINYASSLPNAYFALSKCITKGEAPDRKPEVCVELSFLIEKALGID